MPTKTERILALLPGTFQASAGPSALRALADAFGSELLAGENSLAAVMRAHWVDHADKGAAEILDLARFAALWGLAPRPDEDVEEFREHLKRYVRTFLEGTSTVQGILRITAEALALRIADAPEEMDSWWRRRSDETVTFELRGDDAAELVLGLRSLRASGAPARPAELTGTVQLGPQVDLGDANRLRLAVDGAAPVTVELTPGDPASIVAKINTTVGKEVARLEAGAIGLASPTPGPGSRLEIPEGDQDAAPALLGLPARTVHGRNARAARVTGTVDLSGGADLSVERYLRLAVDEALAEIDCGPGLRTLDQIRDAINAVLPGAASHDGKFLTLTSPTQGLTSRIALLEPAAQDARVRLFGAVPPFHLGVGASPARLTGTRDLSAGADLSERSRLRVSLDGGAAVTVDCAGPDPAKTPLSEIVLALNGLLGAGVASHDGRFLILASPTAGAAGSVSVETAPARDASLDLLGLLPRDFHGSAATAARLTGAADLGSGVDLWGHSRIAVALDGHAPVEIDLRGKAADPKHTALDEIKKALDAALPGVASHDGHFLTLASPTVGAGSALSVPPLTAERRRRFVTRAFVADEAATALLGAPFTEARGEAATAARVLGKTDLSRGVDLSRDRFLRLALDGAPAQEVDCAGPRPRATTLAEVVGKINGALSPKAVASASRKNLLLLSPTSGAGSRIAFEPPRSADALGLVLGVEHGVVRGQDGTTVRFTSTVDLSVGIDLPAGAALKLGIDGAGPFEIALAPGGAAHASLSEIINQINVTVGGTAVATHDGVRLSLTSRKTGADSRLSFEAPAGTDVTKPLFGVTPPRAYQGTAATRARVAGTVDLSTTANLSAARFIRLGIDGAPAVEVDCAAGTADPAQVDLATIVAAVNAVKPGVASAAAGRLVLTSPSEGSASRIALEPHSSGDARPLLFGDVPDTASGTAPAPATITGKVDLLKPADLSKRRVLRLAIDGGAPLDVDVAGASPKQTFLSEVVAALNAAVPGLAAPTEDSRLRLTSPTAGEDSRLQVLPLRVLEIQEYSPEPVAVVKRVRHGDRVEVVNRGAATTPLEIEIRAPQGALAPGLVDTASGVEVRFLGVLSAGETVILQLPAPLLLSRGRTEWLYVEALAARFDEALFDEDSFPGLPGVEAGIFDAGRFSPSPPVSAVFGPVETGPGVEVVLRWASHRPGTFTVNLPADLPARFGGRFDEARFGNPQRVGDPKDETYAGAVTEPEGDSNDLVELLKTSLLVRARRDRNAVRPPLGFEEARVPFRKPRFLTLGSEGAGNGDAQPARLYLFEDGVPGFLEISAVEPGAWGNEISIVTRPAGPGAWDVLVSFPGALFENARETVLGPALPSSAADLLEPGPAGVLQAKAAGIEARVTRDRAEIPSR